MPHTARILVVNAGDDRTAETLLEKMHGHGFGSICGASIAQAVTLAQQERPDALLLLDDGQTTIHELVDALAPSERCRDLPVVVLSKAGGPTHAREDGSRYVSRVSSTVALFAKLDELARLATMRDELRRRSETAERYGIEMPSDVPADRDLADVEVLLVSKDVSKRAFLAEGLPDTAKITVETDPFEALRALSDKSFDIVVAFADQIDAIQTLCADVRANAMLYSLPVLVVSEDGAADQDALLGFGATEVVCAPFDSTDIQHQICWLVGAHRQRRTVQCLYKSARQSTTNDNLTGLYGHGFLMGHLQRQIGEALMWNKALCVGFFNVVGMQALNTRLGYVGGDQMLRHVGGMVGWLVRGEDLAARYSGDEFCVVMPDTAPNFADVVLQRIAGTVNSTDFLSDSTGEPVRLLLRSGYAALEDDDTAESLIARCRLYAGGGAGRTDAGRASAEPVGDLRFPSKAARQRSRRTAMGARAR